MKILLSALFINNIVLVGFLGLEGIINTTFKSKNAFGIIISTILVMIMSSITNYLIYFKLLMPLELEILTLFLFSINIIVMSLLVSWILRRFFNILFSEVKGFIPLAAVSSLVLGMSLISLEKSIDIYNYVYINFCNALGFALIIILLTTIRKRLVVAPLPKNVKGAPILLIILGLLSMAFMGFMGAGAHL